MSRIDLRISSEAFYTSVEVNDWQLEEIRKAITEADNGDFASTEDFLAVANKWKKRQRSLL